MKYKQGSLGLGILSWRGHASLTASLKTYADSNFFGLFDECMIFLPDPDDKVMKAAQQHPLRVETSPNNAGILVGMEEIANRLTTDYVFFTENDCPLVTNRTDAKTQIQTALELLSQDKACMARMRSVKNFGETFTIYDKYLRYFPRQDTFSAKLNRLFRPDKAKRLCGAAIYVEDQPSQKFPKYITKAGNDFYLVDTQVMPWTNQSILIKRSFFLDTIVPYCKSIPLKRNINGFRSIEIELNRSKFWTQSGWKIACGAGLLTHQRVNDRGY